jgi:hypothetical protein
MSKLVALVSLIRHMCAQHKLSFVHVGYLAPLLSGVPTEQQVDEQRNNRLSC